MTDGPGRVSEGGAAAGPKWIGPLLARQALWRFAGRPGGKLMDDLTVFAPARVPRRDRPSPSRFSEASAGGTLQPSPRKGCDMADDDDDWLDKIHQDRRTARDTPEAAAMEKSRLERTYQANADDFWNAIAQELARIVGRYNATADEVLRVEPEGGPSTFRVQWANRVGCRVSFIKAGRLIQVVDYRAHDAAEEATREEKQRTLRVEVTPSGDLTAEGSTPRELAKAVLQDFFESFG